MSICSCVVKACIYFTILSHYIVFSLASTYLYFDIKLYSNGLTISFWVQLCLSQSCINQRRWNRSGRSGFGWTTFPRRFKIISANQKSNAWLRIGLEYEFWNVLKVRRTSKLLRIKSSFATLLCIHNTLIITRIFEQTRFCLFSSLYFLQLHCTINVHVPRPLLNQNI